MTCAPLVVHLVGGSQIASDSKAYFLLAHHLLFLNTVCS